MESFISVANFAPYPRGKFSAPQSSGNTDATLTKPRRAREK